MKIKLSNSAIADLHSIQGYIQRDNPLAAKNIVAQVFESIENLVAFPNIGRPGRVPHTRELVISGTPLIVVYQIKFGCLFIVRLLHGAQKWPSLL